MAVALFTTRGVKGEVVFTNTPKGVRVRAFFTELPHGEHGFHIHKAGDLRGEGCKGACDHFHVGELQHHGGPPGTTSQRHTGDLGNISTDAGPFEGSYYLAGIQVSDLFGRSVIVHGDPDDYGRGGHDDSHTTGHSGARIGCALIGRMKC